MQFDPPLLTGSLIQRYKRFLADVRLDDGRELTAHCPNPGAMLGSRDPGMIVALSQSPNPKRKLPYTLELIHDGSTWIGVNTQRANQIVAEALHQGAIPELAGYDTIQAEVKYGASSRIDFLLSDAQGAQAFVEVKSVTLRIDEACAFPDSVTERGRRHLEELIAVRQAGARAVMLFVLQRSDGTCFRAAPEYDPAYARALLEAQAAGVEILAYRAELSPQAWTLAGPVAVRL